MYICTLLWPSHYPEGGGAGSLRAGGGLAVPRQGPDHQRVRGEQVVRRLAVWHIWRYIFISYFFDHFIWIYICQHRLMISAQTQKPGIFSAFSSADSLRNISVLRWLMLLKMWSHFMWMNATRGMNYFLLIPNLLWSTTKKNIQLM